VRQILIAAAVGLSFTLLGTPIAIRLFRVWGWGQRIRRTARTPTWRRWARPRWAAP
jgi:hypothetical protein